MDISNRPKLTSEKEYKMEGQEHLSKETTGKIDRNSRLILLSGPSTSGKSSIMREFQDRYAKTAVALGCDDFAQDRYAELFKKHEPFSKYYAVLTKVIDDKYIEQFIYSTHQNLRKNHAMFKKGSTKEQQEEALALKDKFPFADDGADGNVFSVMSKANDSDLKSRGDLQDRAFFDAIVSHYDEGRRTVIFDTPNADGFIAHLQKKFGDTYKDLPLQRFLVYVPLTALLGRLEKRNADASKTGNECEKREYTVVLDQFARTYRKKGENDILVDVLKRKDIEKVFKDYEKEIAEENKNRGSNPLTQEAFLTRMGFDSNCTEVAITTDFQKYDGIFRTALQNPTKTVEQLASHTWEKLYS